MSQTYIQIGAGGTGSILYPLLRAYLTAYHRNRNESWELHIIDGDEIEGKNLDRQLFEGRFIMANKAEALVEQFPHANVHAHAKYLGKAEIESSVRSGDTILIAVDNFPLRSHIENHVSTLDNAIVINGGNEEWDGTTQLWIRRNGEDITPRLSEGHPEIHRPGDDRAEMTCQAVAQLPGGEQTLVANAISAGHMLRALVAAHEDATQVRRVPWHTLWWDTRTGSTRAEGAPDLMKMLP